MVLHKPPAGTVSAVAALLCAAGILAAQIPDTGLTLPQAVELALSRNPDVLIAGEKLKEVKGLIMEVRADALPQVQFEGLGLRLRDPTLLNSSSFDRLPEEFREALVPIPANLFELEVRVKQPIYTAGKVRKAIQLAEEGRKEKESALEVTRRQVSYRVLEAFYSLLLAEENLAVVLETREQRRQQLDMARSRFRLGVATEVDVLRSEVNLGNLEPELIRARNAIRLAQSQLNSLLMIDLETPTRILGKLDYRPAAFPDFPSLVAEGLANRPEIGEAKIQLDEARLLLALAEADNKLSVDMEGRFGYSVREPKNLFASDYAKWSLTFNFKLPFYDGGRKAGRVAQAASRFRSAEQALASLENKVRLEIRGAHDAMESSAQQIAASRRSVDQAEKVLGMMQENYRFGAATLLDVVDSQTSLTVARYAHMNATYLYEIAKARLRLATGRSVLEEMHR